MLRLLLLLLVATPVAAQVPLILVSVDGLRPADLGRGDSPVIDALAAGGVSAAMRPSFPSITFPNHYTLVTGLRPDRHGIVANTMLDPAIAGVRFSMGNREAVGDRRWWDEAEPVWVTAEKAGLPTATMFWPGSEAPVKGVRPRRWLDFDGTMTSQARVDRLLGWLDEVPGLRFMTLYFDVVDTAGHREGPGSEGVRAALREVDAAMARLLAGLAARGLAADIVLVSDHGMAETAPERVVRLGTMLGEGDYTLTMAGYLLGIEPVPGREAAVAEALARPHPHVACWPKAEIPARFLYGRHRRVPSFFCLPETGWLVLPDAAEVKGVGGAHGYDHEDPAMAAVFLGFGPSFRAGVRLPDFDNVHVYPLLMGRLGLAALPGDGDARVLAPALMDSASHAEPLAGGAGGE